MDADQAAFLTALAERIASLYADLNRASRDSEAQKPYFVAANHIVDMLKDHGFCAVELSALEQREIDRWISAQPDPKPSRSDLIHSLVSDWQQRVEDDRLARLSRGVAAPDRI